MARKHDRDPRKDRYFVLHHYMLNSEAWKALTPAARAVYIQIGARYDGFNNGKIAFSTRDASSEVGINKDTAGRVFKELVAGGFTEETRHGGLSRKTRVASEWRLTAFKCDLTGALKSNLFLQRGEWARDQHKARSRPQGDLRLSETTPSPVRNEGRECPKRGDSLSETRVGQSPECPKRGDSLGHFDPSPVRNKGAHIVYQVGGLAEASRVAVPDAPADADLAPPTQADVAEPLAAACRPRRARRLSLQRWGVTSADPAQPTHPARDARNRPRHAGRLTFERWRKASDAANAPIATPAFPMIDGIYRIAGRGEPVIVLADPRPIHPLAGQNTLAAPPVAAE